MTLSELWFSQGICPVAGFLGHMVVLFLVFEGTSILFSIMRAITLKHEIQPQTYWPEFIASLNIASVFFPKQYLYLHIKKEEGTLFIFPD